MSSQLLWIEFVLKLAAGLVLVIAPRSTIKLLGLPAASPTGAAFWPRMTGVLLTGIAGASFLQGWLTRPSGLGLAGSALINICLAAMLLTTLVMTRGGMAQRGRILLLLLGFLLITVTVIEASFAEGPRPS